MSDKQRVIEAVQRMSESATLEEISDASRGDPQPLSVAAKQRPMRVSCRARGSQAEVSHMDFTINWTDPALAHFELVVRFILE